MTTDDLVDVATKHLEELLVLLRDRAKRSNPIWPTLISLRCASLEAHLTALRRELQQPVDK